LYVYKKKTASTRCREEAGSAEFHSCVERWGHPTCHGPWCRSRYSCRSRRLFSVGCWLWAGRSRTPTFLATPGGSHRRSVKERGDPSGVRYYICEIKPP